MSNDDQPDGSAVAPEVLARVDPAERGLVRKLVVGAAYAAPAIAAFSLDGISTNQALACTSNLPGR